MAGFAGSKAVPYICILGTERMPILAMRLGSIRYCYTLSVHNVFTVGA
jgi:hypothetical protein